MRSIKPTAFLSGPRVSCRAPTRVLSLVVLFLVVAGCAADPAANPLDDYREVDAVTILSTPDPAASRFDPSMREKVLRGKYLVELLGCPSCHSDGALIGDPEPGRSLAGSRVGIAFSNPLGDERPGIVYPSNITPDPETGIGNWSDAQIEAAIRTGQGRHGTRRIAVMPWPGYLKLTNDDAAAIVSYLRSIDAVQHRVPDEVTPGDRARTPFVYFGVYQSR